MSKSMTEDEDPVTSLSGSMSVPPSSTTPPAGGKRAREDNSELYEPKKKRRRNAKRKILLDDESMELERGINTAISNMDSSLLADYVAQRTKRFAADLSAVELEDIRIPESAFWDTSDWKKARTLEDLPGFLQNCSKRFGHSFDEPSSAPVASGCPHTLVVASAGLRAADLTRALRIFQTKDAAVAKLFAKHIKLRQAVDMVKKTRIGIGVGTPSRVIALLDSGALSLKTLKRIVVDCSHIDQKKRGILDMRETQGPLIQLLNRSELKDRYGGAESDVQLIFY